MANTSESDVVIKALLQRAREFGGLSRKLPPLPGMTDQTITPSEHFMWCMTEVFAEPSLDVWYENAVQELVEGNVHSRAAVINCLHRYVNSSGGAGMYGGGMGGMGGYGPSGTISKFTTRKLIRCCLSLATPDAWSELPSDQRQTAARMTREVVIALPQSLGIGLSQEATDELTSVILAVPEAERSHWEKQFVPANNTDSNDADLSDLESYGMSMADFDEAESVGTDAAPATLFQGRDLASWMEALERERDVASLGEAMRAVETLSRESDEETRLAAAEKTMRLARRLGGIVAGGENDSNPSHHFMTLFLNTFPRYFPDPGVAVVQQELLDGHSNSRIASMWVLNNYLHDRGVGGATPTANTNAEQWLAAQTDGQLGSKRLGQLKNKLLELVDAESEGADGGTRDTMEHRHALDLAKNSALVLALALGESIADNPTLKRYVIEQVNSTKAALHPPGGAMAAYFKPALSDVLLVAAIEVAEKDNAFGTPECWEFLVKQLVSPQNDEARWRLSSRERIAFERFKEAAPDVLLNELHRSLQQTEGWITRSDWFALAIPYYAERFESTKEVSETIAEFDKMLTEQSAQVPEKLRAAIDQAKETIRTREITR
ncbi:hypothetical protein, partial [Stieleria sp.]|uniref:hypothetical protein n=1 Tax=Stieleria sp. TaxID=2795976 RepID=UPI0035634599